MQSLPSRLAALYLPLLLACDSRIETADASSGADSTSTSTGTSMAGPCSTEDGYRICGGPNHCDNQGSKDRPCACLVQWPEHDDLGLCTADIQDYLGQFFACADGTVTIDYGLCIPWSLGMLLCDNGAADVVHDPDGGAFGCAPLPAPSDCPTAVDAPLCGDACGPCDQGEICTGRSTRHPYSMCLDDGTNRCGVQSPGCPSQGVCMVYIVDPPSQDYADRLGLCVPEALCNAAAAGLPGDGVEVPMSPSVKCLPRP